jgi:hypothetical protein
VWYQQKRDMITNNSDLRAKIDEAKRLLPLPQLLKRLGLGVHAKKSALCPLHDDKHPSFSVFQGKGGLWHYKCFAGCSEGDEITFLSKLKGLGLIKAMNLYLEMAGFPPSRPPKSHECHKSPRSPGCPEPRKYHESLVYPMSNGQGLEEELKAWAARNACSERNTARRRRWQLARDLRAVEKRIARKLNTGELMQVFSEWYYVSHPFLDPGKTRDDYFAAFLAELGKVRVPTGEGDTIKKALEQVSTLPVSELPVIPGVPDAPESWRRIAALHRELSRTMANGTHFLSYRDAAKACVGLRHQQAYDITGALVRAGVIEIVSKGEARPGGKAAKFQYLLPQAGNGTPQTERKASGGACPNEELPF